MMEKDSELDDHSLCNASFVSKWLMDNYELTDNASIPRQQLYDHYCLTCEEKRCQVVNPATFGKYLRTVFPTLKTRRLGTRGQSKYHYCGIALRSANFGSAVTGTHNQSRALISTSHFIMNGQNHDQELLTYKDYQFPNLEMISIPHGVDLEALQNFLDAYRANCLDLIKFTQATEFVEIEKTMIDFWQVLPPVVKELTTITQVIDCITTYDSFLYDTLMNMLLPTSEPMSIDMIRSLRMFAKHLESWIICSLQGYSDLLISRRIDVAKLFIQQLRRHTSLNHLSQAVANLLENRIHLEQMVADWCRVDVRAIVDSALWVADCNKHDVIRILVTDVKTLLETGKRVEAWYEWVDHLMTRFVDTSSTAESFLDKARQFILKWTFYSALIMKDLTIRGVGTFESFNVLSLLLQEYLFYTVEERFAHSQANNHT